MKATPFPVMATPTEIHQSATAKAAMGLYATSGKTGGEIAKTMKISRYFFSDLVNHHRVWTVALCEKFLKAIQP